MLRLFVAIEIPEDAAETLGLLRTGVPGARWVRPENLHVTLRFIGEVDEDDAHAIDSALSLIHAPVFSLRLAEVGCFKSGKRARALWAGVEAVEPLKRLQAKVEKSLVSAGLKPESRKFKPHVTLARLTETRFDKIGEFMETHNAFSIPAFTVNHFTLFRSHLNHGGAVYEALAHYPLDRES